MIHRVSANQASFRPVHFEPGMNVVLADRTEASSDRDSRNGLGKSSLIEIISFCLGGKTKPRKGLRRAALAGWVFTIEMTIGGERVEVSRGTDTFRQTKVVGPADWIADGAEVFTTPKWRALLGMKLFGVEPRAPGQKFTPTFRSLFGYVCRRGADAYVDPFKHAARQATWDIEASNAFLIGLDWELARDRQLIREREKARRALEAAAKANLLTGYLGELGELEAERVRLNGEIAALSARLDTFEVHDDYRQIEREASHLTQEIHALSNDNVVARNRLTQLEAAISEVTDEDESVEDLDTLYSAVGVALPEVALARIDEVKSFHRQLVRNRAAFLAAQIDDTKLGIEDREARIRDLSDRRARRMTILESKGALEEFALLGERKNDLVGERDRVVAAIANLRAADAAKSEVKILEERHHQRVVLDHDERRPIWEQAVKQFNANTQTLYEKPGRLVINPKESGYEFDVQIAREESDGVSSMKVFCYDLALATLLATRTPNPGFWIHDSIIFDGVDARQIARALARAAELSEAHGFQYICTLNTDVVPTDDFPRGFTLEPYVRLRLTDDTGDGGLFGFRFE